MIAGVIGVAILLSYVAWIMFSFWFVGWIYVDRYRRSDSGVAALLVMAMIFAPAAFVIGATVGT